jgi:diaminohydroxyphosphoribosylaminopyrimidine deaminase / 5-amino-6-(5-phosphoribosylamino)uracil reductase
LVTSEAEVHSTTSTLTETPMVWTDSDREFMARALELARNGRGLVSPGPMVGCVIVDEFGEVVGEGFYVFEDVKHAETIALAQAGERATGGTAYVSLEPHAHHGRTPPCTEALITAGIRRVVAPIQDLNPRVSGQGFEHLRSAGVEVQTGLLAEEAARVNEAYLHYMRTGRPFVHLKLAVSLDGKIATRTKDSRWVTGPESLQRVHELRHEHDAILIGIGTALVDDPLLTDRSTLPRRRSLVRVVLDDRLELPSDSNLVSTAEQFPLLVVGNRAANENRAKELEQKNIKIISSEDRDIVNLLEELGRQSIASVLVEGGSNVAGFFVDAGLINKATFFIAPKIVGGSKAPTAVGGEGIEQMKDALKLEGVEVIRHGDDIEVTGYPTIVKE